MVITAAKRWPYATTTSFGDKSSMWILLDLNWKKLFTMAAVLELLVESADLFLFAFEVLLHIRQSKGGNLVEQ